MLRARAPRFADAQRTMSDAKGAAKADFTMRRLTAPNELSDGLTGSAQFKRLKFKSEKPSRFQNDCLSCHQIGNERTRRALRKSIGTLRSSACSA